MSIKRPAPVRSICVRAGRLLLWTWLWLRWLVLLWLPLSMLLSGAGCCVYKLTSTCSQRPFDRLADAKCVIREPFPIETNL